ncbi:MAG TPA: DUF1801 domain-containing protein [Actinomycetota bacterium]|nr:DUF1801 domain-containing protein [Actinomycetota bacterium]
MDDPSRDVETWLGQLRPDQSDKVKWLAGLVHEAVQEVDVAIKWRQLTFTVDDNWHHWLCAISVTAQEVNLMFHKGSLLDDPAGMLEGQGRYLRRVRHHRAVANPEGVTALVRQAIVHQTDMGEGGGAP